MRIFGVVGTDRNKWRPYWGLQPAMPFDMSWAAPAPTPTTAGTGRRMRREEEDEEIMAVITALTALDIL